MSDGIQETVRLGLLGLAERVADGLYGDSDNAFQGDDERDEFLNDLQDEVIGKMD